MAAKHLDYACSAGRYSNRHVPVEPSLNLFPNPP
jgi:hypothetical protein